MPGAVGAPDKVNGRMKMKKRKNTVQFLLPSYTPSSLHFVCIDKHCERPVSLSRRCGTIRPHGNLV